MQEPNENTIQIERFLDGEMPAEERQLFETRLKNDAALASEMEVHRELRKGIKKYGEHKELKSLFDDFHAEMDAVPEEKIIPISNTPASSDPIKKHKGGGKMVSIMQLYRTVGIAACFTLLLSFGGFYLFQNHKADSSSNQTTQLEDHIAVPSNDDVSASPEEGPGAEEGGASESDPSENYYGAGATSFVVSENGYLITSAHFVANAKDLRVQIGHDSIAPFKAVIVDVNANLDVALLRITDKRFEKFDRVSYLFKNKEARIAEEVFTLGFPDQALVYGLGSITALKGAKDTIDYLISVPLNPGNSGSPLLNERGEIVGMVSERHNFKEGASYAIKSNYLIDFIEQCAENLGEDEPKLVLSKRNYLKGRKRPDQIERLEPFVFPITAKKLKEPI